MTDGPVDYLTLGQLKAWPGAGIGSSDSDANLQAALSAASRTIDAYCKRTFWRTGVASVRKFQLLDPTHCAVDDIADQTTITFPDYPEWVLGTTIEAWPLTPPPTWGRVIDDVQQWPISSLIAQDTWFDYWQDIYSQRGRLKVSAEWGCPYIPDAVKMACYLLATRLFKRKDAPEGIMGWSDIGALHIRSRDPDVAALLDPYSRIEQQIA